MPSLGTAFFSPGRLPLRLPEGFPRRLQMRQIQAQVEFVLVVVRFHPQAHVVEGLVVVLLFQVRQLMHRDHLQELGRHRLEQRRHADLVLGAQLAALHPRNVRVLPQRMLDHVDLAVVGNLVDQVAIAHIGVLQVRHVLVQRAVGAYGMRAVRVARQQCGAQFALV